MNVRAGSTPLAPILLIMACLAWAAGCAEQAADAPAGPAPAAAGASSGTADPAPADPAPLSGAELFQERCAGCHGNPDVARAMAPEALARLNGAQIVFAMTNGTMKTHAAGLDTEAMLAIATFIGGSRETYQPAPAHYCTDGAIDITPIVGRWAVDARSSGTLPAGASRIHAGNVASLELAWAFGLPDVANARSQPVITANTLFVAATSGHLFALDRHSGCIRWHRPLAAAPRTALTLGTVAGRPALLFGDIEAHVNAVDPLSGESLWRVSGTVSEHSMLTGALVQHADRLIVPVSIYEVALAADPDYPCCRSHGAVLALDAATGERLWTTPTTAEATPRGESAAGVQRWGPSGAPVWSTPTVDPARGLVYVGTGQNASQPVTDTSDAVLALNLETGAIVWQFQTIAGDAYNLACDTRPPGPNCPRWPGPDHDIGAAVVLHTDAAGRDRLLVGQKSGDLYALDPEAAGAVLWHRRVGAGSPLGGVHWGLAVADGVIHAPVNDPPYPYPNYRPAPGLYAVSAADGALLWERPVERGCTTNLFDYFGRTSLYPACSFFFGLSAAPLAVNDLVFAGALNGKLRAFARATGEVLWATGTARRFAAVNGVETHGGAIDVAPPLAAGGMLYVQSGYAQFGQLPGNALLAYRLPER